MARHPRPENASNALRQLREMIPATQPELSRLIDVPLDTIKSIEAARRPLSEEVQKKIAFLTGAIWNDGKKQWCFRSVTGSPWDQKVTKGKITLKRKITDELVPCTCEHIRAYRDMMEQEAGSAYDCDAVKMRIDALFDQIPSRYWLRLFKSIQGCLDELQDEFTRVFKDKAAVERTFRATTDITDLAGRRSYPLDWDGEELIRYRDRMAKEYTQKTKHVELHPDGSWTQKF
jgi:DNA-binding XRE family transcriptional regulator